MAGDICTVQHENPFPKDMCNAQCKMPETSLLTDKITEQNKNTTNNKQKDCREQANSHG